MGNSVISKADNHFFWEIMYNQGKCQILWFYFMHKLGIYHKHIAPELLGFKLKSKRRGCEILVKEELCWGKVVLVVVCSDSMLDLNHEEQIK